MSNCPVQQQTVSQLNMSAKAIRSSSVLLKEDLVFVGSGEAFFFASSVQILSVFYLQAKLSDTEEQNNLCQHWCHAQRHHSCHSDFKSVLFLGPVNMCLLLCLFCQLRRMRHWKSIFWVSFTHHLLAWKETFEWFVRPCSSLFCTLGVVVFCSQYRNELSNIVQDGGMECFLLLCYCKDPSLVIN